MKNFTVADVQNAECTLESMQCIFCKSLEVTYYQYIGDAHCAACGEWQTPESEG